MQNLVGELVGDLAVETCLSDGTFAQVYKAKNAITGKTSALKLAQPNNTDAPGRASPDQSQALEEITGTVLQVRPNPRALLHYQMSFTQSVGQEVFPEFISVIEETDRELVGYGMEFIDGVTLKDLIAANNATIDHVIALAQSLEKLLSCAPYHGDLKPSNVIFDGMAARLLDPGFFGNMESADGNSFPMKITTPIYYPLLEPDDFLALGLIAWEVIFGRHPLKYTEYQDAEITRSFDLMVRRFENCGQFFLSPIRKLPTPGSLVPQLNPAAEGIFLKLLRLALVDQGKLDVDPGYQSISEILETLKDLRSML